MTTTPNLQQENNIPNIEDDITEYDNPNIDMIENKMLEILEVSSDIRTIINIRTDDALKELKKDYVTKTYNHVFTFIGFIVGIIITLVVLFSTIKSDITANTTNIQTLKTTTTNQISTFKTTFTHDEHLLTQMLSYITDKKYLSGGKK